MFIVNDKDFAGAWTLPDLVEEAITIGCGDRHAPSISRAAQEARLADPERLAAEGVVKALATIGDVANQVRKAVTASMPWQSQVMVPVMFLDNNDYPGGALRSPQQLPESELSHEQLRYGARIVFDALVAAGRNPRIIYKMNDDIRRYELFIAIVVDTPASVDVPLAAR
jgi:hypothetical protein